MTITIYCLKLGLALAPALIANYLMDDKRARRKDLGVWEYTINNDSLGG